MPRGFNLDAQIAYGSSAESFHEVTHAIKQYGIKRVADVAKTSVRHVRIIYHRKASPSERMLEKLLGATVQWPFSEVRGENCSKPGRQSAADP
jgi:hypothetical protein